MSHEFQLKAWLMESFKRFSSSGEQNNPVTPSDEHNEHNKLKEQFADSQVNITT